jgi:hypothetical protein
MTTLKFAAFVGALSFFVLWGFVCWGLINQDWPQVTAFAAVLCAIHSAKRSNK